MKRPFQLLALAAFALVLGSTSKARAWGAAHVGYTHVGAGGVQHYGRTVAAGPYGAYSGSHASAYGAAGGAYHAGSASAVHYGGYGASAYHYGGVSAGYHAGGYYGGGYSAGVYRIR